MESGTRSSYAVRVADQPVHDTHDPADVDWLQAGGSSRDQGRYVELISRSLTGSEVLFFGISWLEPGETHILHHHPEAEELYYVIEGTAIFTVGDEEIRGEPGTAIFLPKGTPHRIFNDGSTKLAFSWCFSRPELKEVGIVWDE